MIARSMNTFALFLAGAAALMPVPVRADIELLGIGVLPGNASDRSGLSGKLADGTSRDRLGGLGSGIAYTGVGDRYVMISDRGPKDGAVDFPCRFHVLDIAVIPKAPSVLKIALIETVLLADEKGKLFSGAMNAFDGALPHQAWRLDAEGIRVGPNGTVFIADEYGPTIAEFNSKGRRLRSLPVPSRFFPAKPGATVKEEMPPHNRFGRQPNRGLEGLAISPDGSKVFGLMQGPLLQDGALDKDGERVGVNCRLLELHIASGKSREFVYQLQSPETGVSELLALNDHEFLVLERDGNKGESAELRRIYRVELQGATNISHVDSLPARQLPPNVQPAAKIPLLDLLDPRFRGAGPEDTAKFEGLAFGPNLPDGRRLLLVTVDNDFVAAHATRIFAFAIDRADLPSFQAQEFKAVFKGSR